MDQSLKARLIGATVLVILAVLLIPELLSGRKSATSSVEEAPAGDRRTFTIDIGKSGGTATAPQVPRPQPSTTEAPPPVEPAPARSPVGDSGPVVGDAETSTPRTAKSDAPPPVPAATQGAGKTPAASDSSVAPTAPATAPAAGAGGGSYFVQVGAFGSAQSARKLVAQLEADGYPAQLSPVTKGGKTLHRVRVGPAASRAAAQQLAERLKARGLPVSLVTSD
jgi:cell division septation protein DedD